MKLFAMLMLRCALVMLLSSLLQNGTLAQNEEEYLELHRQLKSWEGLCRPFVVAVSDWHNKITLDDPNDIRQINQAFLQILSLFIHSFDGMLGKLKEFPLKEAKVNEFPIGGMGERLKRRLQKPLKIAKLNCKKLEDKITHSGRQDNKNYLESLLYKIHSIADGIDKEFNTFIIEVELKLFTKFYRTLQKRFQLVNKLLDFARLSTNSYIGNAYFVDEWLKLSSGMGNNPRYEPGTTEFVDFVESFILNAKLKILETEFPAKIAGFAQQQPHLDWDEFVAFSQYFKIEWNQIVQMIRQLTSNDDKDTFRERLDNLAEKAMEETDPLKAIITEKLGQLFTKCQNSSGKFNKEETSNQRVATKGKGPSKTIFKKVRGSHKRDQKEQKEEAKKKEIDAMKQIISDIGMFDGAAYKLLVLFEHEELDNTDFCAELEKAVAEDKEMVSKAYQVQQDKKLRRTK